MKSAFFVILIFSLLTACAPTAAPTSAPTATLPATLTPAPTVSATPTPKPTFTETLPPTSSSTPTAVPTLSAEAARARLLELLANNDGCRLPCLWGITPGKSSYLEARSILLPLRDIARIAYFDPAYLEDSISPLYVEGIQRLNSQIDYWYSMDGIINMMRFRALEERVDKKDEYGNQIKIPIFDSPTFLKRVEYYSLSHILSEQGMPDSVMVQASGLLVGGVMDIALLYPNQGIWVNYTTKIIYNNGVVKRGCPINSHIDMFLFSSGDPTSFFSLLDNTDWGVTKNWYKPLDEVTAMSVEQFYQTFRNPTEKCIETPSNLWPTPEPGGG